MTLSKKTLLIVSVAFIGLMAILSLMASLILSRGFNRLEINGARDNIERVLSAIEFEIDAVDTTTGDYANWDDTYAFVQGRVGNYIKSNMNNTTFAQLKIHAVIIMNNDGEIVFSTGYDPKQDRQFRLPEEIRAHFRPGRLLAVHNRINVKKTGILRLNGGGMLISSRPILTSKYTGPVMGTMVMGRNIDGDLLQRWARLTKTAMSLRPLAAADLHGKNGGGEMAGVVVEERGADTIEGYTNINDIYGKPAFQLQIRMGRPVRDQGRKIVGYLMTTFLIVFALFGTFIIWLLKRSIIARLLKMGAQVKEIGLKADFSARVDAIGNDELALLGKEINGMIAKLEASALELRNIHNVVQRNNEILLEQIEERKRTEAALKQSEERFMKVFRASPTPKALIVAAEETFSDINERFRSQFGYRRGDVAGKKVATFFEASPDERHYYSGN